MKKVVLAFSGGLDTSYCAIYLSKEMGLEVHAALANTGGLTLFDPATGMCRPLLDDKEHRARTRYCKDLELDGEGYLWFTRLQNGVGCCDLTSGNVMYYRHNPDNPNSLSGNRVNHIFRDSKGNMWFGMDGTGLDVYLREEERFKNFNSDKDGLSGNKVYAVCELSEDSLLVTTDKGISVFDVASERFTNYQSRQNFPRFPINKKSLFRVSNGEVFAGGMEGMLSFFPDHMERSFVPYRILPYRLTVNGTEINPGDSTKILAEELTTLHNFTLPPSCATFTLNYTATDYLSPYPNKLSYQLKGFSDTWMDMQGKNSVTFTNLPPGTYELTVKAKNAPEGIATPSRLSIRIQPPLWKTGWAYAGYLLAIGIAVGYVVQETDDWCATFVSAMAISCGLTDIIPTECGCQRQIGLFQELGTWEENDAAIPLPGDIIYYDWDSRSLGDCTGWADHVGIVVGTKWPFVKVIEGNKDDAVGYRIVLINDIHIRGYGRPDYASLLQGES